MGRLTYSPQVNINIESLPESSSFHCTLESLNDQIQKFWNLEEIGVKNNYSIEEKQCEEHYVKHVSRDKSGRYSVSLPIKTNISELGESSSIALRQFNLMFNKLCKNSDLKAQYCAFMNEYIDFGHMVLVDDPQVSDCEYDKVYYLPHHHVIKESSTTTKLRVVFNASAKTLSGVSLNDCLSIGPTIQQDLFSLIIRFRKHLFALTGDITKMYRQIKIDDNQQDLHRIWWKDSLDDTIKCYRLCTVTYGTASAPYLAVRTLHQLASDEETNYPDAAKVLKRDFYIDDCLSGANSILEVEQLKSNLIDLLSLGGFELRKIQSNLHHLSSDENSSAKCISILGLEWNTENDNFNIVFNQSNPINKFTKRLILSDIAQLFDPLGICAPMIFTAKLIMQSLWATPGLTWDDDVPSDRWKADKWKTFKTQILNLDKISIFRCVIPRALKGIELHGFGDASERGYGCVIYIRTMDIDNNYHINLLCAKSRVAPLKQQTIPRLELCAALLLSKLMHRALSALEIEFDSICYWTDSEITLLRVKSVPSRFQTFVANRISQIQENSIPDNWCYVPSELNPADHVSRGLMPEDLLHTKLWWKGPEYLYSDKNVWPKSPNTSISTDLLEFRKSEIILTCTKDGLNSINKFSDFNKLLRVTSLCLRFLRNGKTPLEDRKYGDISAIEMDSALKTLVKYVQYSDYAEDIEDIIKTKTVSQKSKLKALSPFLDNDGILRVGGRLHHANIPFDHQHQMIVSGSNYFSILLIRHEHLRHLHSGPQSLLYILRLRFWIINGRSLCRKIVRECIRCVRMRPHTLNQIMGQLPEHRVNSSRPFLIIGVDFCGPFNITHKLRSKVITKVYIAVSICFATKAIHMEIVGDLSTQAFIAAFRRFIARRGLCVHVYSDNATNFVGSKSELQELRRLFLSEMHQNEVLRFCATENIQWHTIPPRSPHFGGLWEAAVKSAKFHMKRVLGLSNYTAEELHTLIVQIEACLNSRPITPMSNDVSDMSCLTPGHFLIGQPLVALPDPTLQHLDFNRLSRFQRIQYLLQQFWNRWSNEYLSELQHRRKWNSPSANIQIGSLVLLQEDNVPPLKWNMGRVTDVHSGSDGVVRVVTIKSAQNELKRAITKIALLPIKTDFESEQTKHFSELNKSK